MGCESSKESSKKSSKPVYQVRPKRGGKGRQKFSTTSGDPSDASQLRAASQQQQPVSDEGGLERQLQRSSNNKKRDKSRTSHIQLVKRKDGTIYPERVGQSKSNVAKTSNRAPPAESLVKRSEGDAYPLESSEDEEAPKGTFDSIPAYLSPHPGLRAGFHSRAANKSDRRQGEPVELAAVHSEIRREREDMSETRREMQDSSEARREGRAAERDPQRPELGPCILANQRPTRWE